MTRRQPGKKSNLCESTLGPVSSPKTPRPPSSRAGSRPSVFVTPGSQVGVSSVSLSLSRLHLLQSRFLSSSWRSSWRRVRRRSVRRLFCSGEQNLSLCHWVPVCRPSFRFPRFVSVVPSVVVRVSGDLVVGVGGDGGGHGVGVLGVGLSDRGRGERVGRVGLARSSRSVSRLLSL